MRALVCSVETVVCKMTLADRGDGQLGCEREYLIADQSDAHRTDLRHRLRARAA